MLSRLSIAKALAAFLLGATLALIVRGASADVAYSPVRLYGIDSGGTQRAVNVNASGQITTTLMAGEDQTYNRQWGGTLCAYATQYTADATAIKTGGGILQGVVFNSINALDDIVIYDNTANSGTVLLTVTNQAVSQPFVATGLGIPFSTGMSLDVTFNAGSTVTLCWQ